jgi:hypothetical protein
MAITQLNQLQIAYKKLLGKAHVSPNRTVPQEGIGSLIQIGNTTVFGEIIPTSSAGFPSNAPANLYQTSSNGKVELVRFQLTQLSDGDYTPANGSLNGTSIDDQAENTTNGAHAYALRISGSYNTRSNNPNKNTGFFKDGTFLTGSLGALQLVPPTFGNGYSAFVYSSNGTQIAESGPIDWSLDYSTGVLFVQDYSATATEIPAFVDAYLYIGKYTNEVISDINTAVSNTNAYASASVGGTVLISSAAGDRNLTFASGAFAGISNTNNNLLISGSAGTDTITFSFNDSPRFTNITASGNISGSGNISITGNGTIGGTLDVTGTTTLAGNLLANGNTTLGNATGDTLIISGSSISVPSIGAGTTDTVIIRTATNTLATRNIDTRVWGSTLISGSGTANQIAYFNATTGIVGDTALTYNAGTDVLTVNGSTFGQDVTIAGNLTVNGDTTIINTSNISIEDKFIVLGRSSGSLTPSSEGGIIIEGANGSGSAFVFNSGSGGANGLANRWGVALGVPTGSMNVTPTDFMVTVSASSAAPSNSNAPTFGSASFGFGNMHIQDNGDIWIYS